MKESKEEAAARAHLLQRTKDLGLDFLDHENTLWMFCPAEKVFDFGDAGYHYLFNEYGKTRSKFMRKALEDAHPQFQPEFVPSSKKEAYANLLRQAIADGKKVGRKPKLEADKQKLLFELIDSGQKTQAQMARIFGVNRAVISRMVSKERGDRYP